MVGFCIGIRRRIVVLDRASVRVRVEVRSGLESRVRV